MMQVCNQSLSQRHSSFLVGENVEVIFNRNFHSDERYAHEMKSTDNTSIPQLKNCAMTLYGAIETPHGTEQCGALTIPSRDVSRDRFLKVNAPCCLLTTYIYQE